MSGDWNLIFPFIAFAVSFLIGSIPFGVFVAKIFKVSDLTKKGSGNIGATNVVRVAGWPAGLITFLLDFGKGALPVVLLSSRMFLDQMGVAASNDLSDKTLWAVGFASVLGHCFSPWLHFKGGKGVATGFGVMTVLSPIAAAAGVLAFAITFFHRRIASLSSIAGLVVACVVFLATHVLGMYIWFGGAMALLILIRHEANIDALLENRERRFE